MNSLQQSMPQIQCFSRTKSTQPVCWNWLAGYWQIVVKSTRTSFSCWQRDKLLGVQPWEPFHTLTPPSRHHTKHGIWLCVTDVTAVCALQNAAICFQAKLQNRCSHLRGDRSCFRCGRVKHWAKELVCPSRGRRGNILLTDAQFLAAHTFLLSMACPTSNLVLFV